MKRLSLILFLSFLAILDSPAEEMVDHRFYYSRTVMRPSRQGHTLEIEMRLFTDDLELAIDREGDLTRLGTDLEASDANFRIEDYLRSHFALYINDQFTDYRFWGKEVDFDITYCYMEASLPRDVKAFEVLNRVLMDVYPDQVNEIDVTLNGVRKRYSMTIEWPAYLITY